MSYEFIYIIYQTTKTFLYSLCTYPFVKLYAEIGIWSKIEYEDILTCRLNNSKCGVKGRFYKQK